RLRGARPHRLVLHPLGDHPAALGIHRDAEAAARIHHRRGAARGAADRRVRAGAGAEQDVRRGRGMRIAESIGVAAAGALAARAARPAKAAESETPPTLKWSFAGPFGMYDEAQLQRGFKVYREVCQNCHGINLLAFRNLADPGGPGFSRAQATAIAAQFQVTDGPNDQGEMFQRAGRLADYFPPPFANEQAARARYNAVPPAFSTLAKARGIERGFPWFIIDMFTQYQEGGVDYIAAYVNGYEDNPPAGVTIPAGAYFNKYFPGHATSMPKPLVDGQVD